MTVVAMYRWMPALLVALLVPAAGGCRPQPVDFSANAVWIRKQERTMKEDFAYQRRQDIQTVLTAMFGTPDDPHLPTLGETDVGQVLDVDKLAVAAGPVGRDASGRARGLYREHCAHCHGVTGDGQGPTAVFLNPYPRDYRMGVFKFKSTPRGVKPTHEDLSKILIEGIPGTAMPSFRLLADDERDALIQYVRYLAIRGEVERNIVLFASQELEPEDRLVDTSLADSAPDQLAEQLETVRSLVSEVVDKWAQADAQATPVPGRQEGWRDTATLTASQRRGKELFYGAVANCVKCHGESALGDGQTTDYDEWNKELDPHDAEAVHDYVSLGALPPRNIIPRNLRQGIYRGGRRPVDLYWRIRNGIDGTPMPASTMLPEGAPPGTKGLTEEDIWSLVDYVRSLPFESISRPADPHLTLQRERM